MSAAHTPGPWRWELNQEGKNIALVGGVKKYDLTIMDFERWGMSGATMRLRDTAFEGMNFMHKLHERPDWIEPEESRKHHRRWHQLVVHPDARLIAAAPDLLAALIEIVAGDKEAIEEAQLLGFPFSDEILATYGKACAAIAKATGSAA